jgi:hypothetical protein
MNDSLRLQTRDGLFQKKNTEREMMVLDDRQPACSVGWWLMAGAGLL